MILSNEIIKKIKYDTENYTYINNVEKTADVRAYFNIHLGYRLNDNKPMRKFFGWFEDHLGF